MEFSLKNALLSSTVLAGAAALMMGGAAPAMATGTCGGFTGNLGADTACGIVITLNSGGTATVTATAGQGPYDGIEDTLIGVVNNSGASVNSLSLSATTTIFAFDNDGIEPIPAPATRRTRAATAARRRSSPASTAP